MLKKLCSYPGCHKVVEAGVKYCDRHKNTDREKYREYKRKRMENEEEARRQQFYNSKAWEGFRGNQEAAQLGVDIFEYYTTGIVITAEQYHHIEEVTEAWACYCASKKMVLNTITRWNTWTRCKKEKICLRS